MERYILKEVYCNFIRCIESRELGLCIVFYNLCKVNCILNSKEKI